jgi:hypothetical protein
MRAHGVPVRLQLAARAAGMGKSRRTRSAKLLAQVEGLHADLAAKQQRLSQYGRQRVEELGRMVQPPPGISSWQALTERQQQQQQQQQQHQQEGGSRGGGSGGGERRRDRWLASEHGGSSGGDAERPAQRVDAWRAGMPVSRTAQQQQQQQQRQWQQAGAQQGGMQEVLQGSEGAGDSSSRLAGLRALLGGRGSGE